MLRVSLVLFFMFGVAVPARAQAKPKADPAAPTVLLETWQAAYFEGLKVGHMHTRATRTGTGAGARIQTVRAMELVIKRYGSVLALRIDQTSVEKPDGKVLSLGLTQQLGKSPKTELSGKVVDGKLEVQVGDGVRAFPWDDSVIGLYAQDTLFQQAKAKPGDKLTLASYEIMLPGKITVRGLVKDREKVDRLDTEIRDGKVEIVRKPVVLLRVDTVPDPIDVGGEKVQLPKKVIWLDAKLMPIREQFDMPGLGPITLYTTTKEAALKEGVAPDRLPDFGLNINIPLKQTIENPYRTTAAVYRVTVKEKLPRLFSVDERQTLKALKDNTFELTVNAVTAPEKGEEKAPPSTDFLESNNFIDSDNDRIRELAKKVVGAEKDPWKKALLVERWVHDNMKVSSAVGFPNASQIAKDLEGDCRQHALLLVALSRAAGVPARTAIGLIYVREPGRSPHFGFHMWGEVWVRGKWVALDAVLGQGKVAATHLKMGDHSWSKTATLAPLLPISQTLGKLQIEVLGYK